MGKKFKVWLDSGANVHSCREQIVDLEDFGVSDEEWDEMSVDDQEEFMRDVAWDRMDWGYYEED